MHYSDGTEVRLHDRVRLSNGDIGTVVLSVDTDEYSDGFLKADWVGMGDGVLIKTDRGALVRFDSCDTFELSKHP